MVVWIAGKSIVPALIERFSDQAICNRTFLRDKISYQYHRFLLLLNCKDRCKGFCVPE